MGNLVSSIVSGIMGAIGDLIGPSLDFLSGKDCGIVCGPTWDILCYIENFCVASLFKVVPILFLLFVVLFFLYLLYKIGICGCMCKNTFKMFCAFISSFISACEFVTMFLRDKITNVKRDRLERKLQMEEYFSSSFDEDDIESRYVDYRRTFSQKLRADKRRLYMQKSLQPRSHRISVGIGKNTIDVTHARGVRRRRDESLHNIRVTHTSRFVQKARGRRLHHKRW